MHEYIKVDYVSFNVILESHPSIVGFVRVSSNKLPPIEIRNIVNNPLLNCYPNTSIRGKFPTASGSVSLEQGITIARNQYGASPVYVVIDSRKGAYAVHFHEAPHIETK